MAPVATYGYFCDHQHDAALGATTVVASAEDSEYPATNLISEDMADPAKLTAASGTFVLGFDSAIAPVAVVLANQYLDAGLSVYIEGNSSNSWGSPAFSQAITIPAKRKDGPQYQPWTNNAYAILSGSPSYAWWRLNVSGTNSQSVAVGRLLLPLELRRVKLLVDQDLGESDTPEGQIDDKTELGVDIVMTIGGPRRSVEGVAVATDRPSVLTQLDDAAYFRALHETVEGRQHPFLFFPFGQSNEPWLGRFTSASRQRTHKQQGVQMWPWSFLEDSRGLPWP
jgi:hypothetical protein